MDREKTEADKREIQRRLDGFGGKMAIQRHGYPNCSCCPAREERKPRHAKAS